VIRVRNLGKNFRDQVALKGASFDVEPGECFALLGPNGSGKTTALKCLAGLVLPSSGTMEIGGHDVVKNGRAARALMSYLPQQVSFPDHLRVREVLEFYARLRNVPAGRIDLAMEMLGCTEFAGRFVTGLSGGMRQRLAIAVACLPDAPLLMLDEPTASLDPESAAGFRRLLAGFKRAGKTIVFATHVLADVEHLADRIAILVNGRLLAVKTLEESGLQQLGCEEVYLRYLHASDDSGGAGGPFRRLRFPVAAAG
jgi:ABC-type multidrug transport system ATPase subunit